MNFVRDPHRSIVYTTADFERKSNDSRPAIGEPRQVPGLHLHVTHPCKIQTM